MNSTAPLPSQALKIVRIQEETEQAKSFVLEPVGGVLEYKPGQFLTLLFTSITGEPVRRSYSLSSTPVLGEPLTMTVKRVINGEFSRKLVDHFKEGDVLKTIGASGFFILPEFVHRNDRFVLVAAGSGITPVFALIKTLIHLHPENKILLIYANSDRRSTIFYRALLELSERSANFEIVWLFSRTPDLGRSRLTPDLLEQLLREHDIEPGLPIFYICGPPALMRMATFKLSSLNFPASRIKKEIFVAEKIVETPKPPDLEKHEVVLLKDDKRYSFSVQYPATILGAARTLGISIPYSCENGQCGTCVARCIEGRVWMARNDVLLDNELNEGLILTCTGFPVHGNVTLVV